MSAFPERRNIGFISEQALIPTRVVSETSSKFHNARQLVESHIGALQQTDAITGGLVSYVYRVKGEQETGIVKVKGEYLAKLPHIPIDPKDIEYEWTTLQFLSQIEPETFPQPLAFDRDTSMILMSDIMPSGQTLETRLETHGVDQAEIIVLGTTVARIHRKIAHIETPIRDSGDEEIYSADLHRRLGYQNHPVLNNVVDQLNTLPKQLILADLSPKNIGRGEDGQITICDLEFFYQGHLQYAYGYLAGHILLHTLDDPDRSEAFLPSLIDGYQAEDKKTDFDSMLLKRIALGSALYRLSNAVIPYNISLTPEQRVQKANKAFELLEKDTLSWTDITHGLSAS